MSVIDDIVAIKDENLQQLSKRCDEAIFKVLILSRHNRGPDREVP